MMTKKWWVPLACKDLFLAGKQINYMCRKKDQPNPTKQPKNNLQKTLGGLQNLKYVPQNS